MTERTGRTCLRLCLPRSRCGGTCVNIASKIAGMTTDGPARNRSLVLATWLCNKGILSAGVAAEFADIPTPALLYRMEKFGEGPAFDLLPGEPAHDAATDIRDTLINRDPEIMGATPVFMGTRVPVSILIDHLTSGYTLNYFVDHYPTVSRVQAVRFLELATETLTANIGTTPHKAGKQRQD